MSPILRIAPALGKTFMTPLSGNQHGEETVPTVPKKVTARTYVSLPSSESTLTTVIFKV